MACSRPPCLVIHSKHNKSPNPKKQKKQKNNKRAGPSPKLVPTVYNSDHYANCALVCMANNLQLNTASLVLLRASDGLASLLFDPVFLRNMDVNLDLDDIMFQCLL